MAHCRHPLGVYVSAGSRAARDLVSKTRSCWDVGAEIGHAAATITPKSPRQAMGGFEMHALWRRLILACVGLVPISASAEPIKLRITAQLPASNHLVVNLKQFKDELEARTKGEIRIEIF